MVLAAFTVTAGAKWKQNEREMERRPRRRKMYFLKGKGSSNKVKTGLRLGDGAGFREIPKHLCRFYTPSRPSLIRFRPPIQWTPATYNRGQTMSVHWGV